MPVKQYEVPPVGLVKLYKRRDARSIKITLRADYIRVTMPYWLPYKAGLEFVKNQAAWIENHKKPSSILIKGQLMGKAHRLKFQKVDTSSQITSRITQTEIIVKYPVEYTEVHPSVQASAKKASQRALRQEAEHLLPQRLAQLAKKHSFSYSSIKIKHLKSRWGSCDKQSQISLNAHLMQLPWQLIDYVILHELTHTKFLNHSSDFWTHLLSCMPDAKQARKQLNTYNPNF